MHRPAPATVISLIALFFAMSGTAVAATGGDFLLGQANTATAVTALSNTRGTALSLSSTATTPALKVSNSVQVPKLNASELGGQQASAFLGVTGTAANSNELGGQPPSAYLPATGTAANASDLGGVPASGYMQGGGTTTGGRLALTGAIGEENFLAVPGGTLDGLCGNAGTGASVALFGNSGTASGATVMWRNKDGVADDTGFTSGSEDQLTPASTTPYVVVAQVDNVTSITTITVSQWYDSGSGTCHFTAQAITTNG